jgi:RimJ/RimL family protein N-acetyltransferase
MLKFALVSLAKLGFEPWLKTSGHGFDDVRYTILRRPDAPVADASRDVVCSFGGLTARLLQPADQLDFFMLEGNANVLRYADGELISYEESGAAIQRLRRSDADLKIYAVSTSERPFVGTVATVDEGASVELGYRLLESCWGQGLGRPIAALALALARQEYPDTRVYARCDLRNGASMKVLAGLEGSRLPDADGHATWEW